jgi:hypothetical protein
MATFTTGATKKGVQSSTKPLEALPYVSGLREGEEGRPRIRKGPHRKPPKQNPATDVRDGTGPGGQDHEIIFPTYTPLPDPKNPGLFGLLPPDMSGADSSSGVVLFCGNTYLGESNDHGASFADLDSSTFLPAAQGRPVDQVVTYIPRQEMFAWMMQHGKNTAGDGTFRLAVARTPALSGDFTGSWTVFDFTSTDVGFPGVATDRQDLSFTKEYLYLTTNLVGKGRIVIRIPLNDLAQGLATPQYTAPLDGVFQFSDLSQQHDQNIYMAGILNDSTLRVFSCTDGSTTYQTRDLPVGSFPRAGDLVSKDPNGVDWLTRGVANVSAVLARGDDLWIAWDAAESSTGSTPFYPNPHIRMAKVKISTWTVVAENQVWNPDYAFAYGTLALDTKGNVGYGVGVGGKTDFPMSCFGVLGDFVVYYQDNSDATAIGSDGAGGTEARWGDYITARPSDRAAGKFAGFGYFTKKTAGGGFFQTPYYLVFGRP